MREELTEIFHCDGIEDFAIQMRRRVQLGMAVEFVGTQVANLLMLSGGGIEIEPSHTTFFIENSNAAVALHIFVVWRYAGFLRDALLARHVTRIALVRPSGNETPLLNNGEGVDAERTATGPSEGVELLVETGPWQRRVKLAPLAQATTQSSAQEGLASSDDEEQHVEATFGQMLRSGLLHVDRDSGQVLDTQALEGLLEGQWRVVGEEVTTDVPSATRAFVDPNKLAGFLSDGADGAYLGRLLAKPWLHPVLQCRGSRLLDWFGLASLAMGFGSAAVWLYPRR